MKKLKLMIVSGMFFGAIGAYAPTWDEEYIMGIFPDSDPSGRTFFGHKQDPGSLRLLASVHPAGSKARTQLAAASMLDASEAKADAQKARADKEAEARKIAEENAAADRAKALESEAKAAAERGEKFRLERIMLSKDEQTTRFAIVDSCITGLSLTTGNPCVLLYKEDLLSILNTIYEANACK